jgi:hypothetical protein
MLILICIDNNKNAYLEEATTVIRKPVYVTERHTIEKGELPIVGVKNCNESASDTMTRWKMLV